MAERKVGKLQAMVPFFISFGDLCVCTSFGTIENLTAHVLLGTSIIDHCIHRMFPSERKVVPLPSRPMEILSTKMVISSVNADNIVFNVNAYSQDDTSSDVFALCCVTHQIKIPAHTLAAELVRFQGAWLMMIETTGRVV